MDNVKIIDWLDKLADKSPTPGGGAVAALSAAISAAQLEMVAIYTTGPKWQDRETRMNELAKNLSGLRARALDLIHADSEAFSEVGSAYGLPKSNDHEKSARKSAIQKALISASQPPVDTTKLAIKLVSIAVELAKTGNPSVISDVAVGATMARSALESAVVNIEINQHSIKDQNTVNTLKSAVKEAADAIQDADMVTGAVRDRMAAP